MTPQKRSAEVFAKVREEGLSDPATSPLRRARLLAGLTLDQLGERAYISAAEISKFERGLRLPPKRTRVHISNALGASESDLFPEAR